jgi:hypothetical protein
MADRITAGNSYLTSNYTVLAAMSSISNTSAQAYIEAFKVANGHYNLEQISDYLLQFYPVLNPENQNPLALIYFYLKDIHESEFLETMEINGSFLEIKAPGQSRLYIPISGYVEEWDLNYNWKGTGWANDNQPGVYSDDNAYTTTVTGNSVNIIFGGTGISLIYSKNIDGATANWLIDGGSGGSGTVDMFDTIRQDIVQTQLATGLADTLHILTITHSGTGSRLYIDAVDIENRSRYRVENTSSGFSIGSGWVSDNNVNYSKSNINYILSSGTSSSVTFNGTAVALISAYRGDYGTISWSIDGGLGGSGTVNQGDTTVWEFRHQDILTTALDPGSHTLTLSHSGTGWLVNIDSIDFYSAGSSGSQARYEAELIGSPPGVNDVCGYDMFTWWGLSSPEAGASNNALMYSGYNGATCKFIFAGTGVDLIVKRQGNGGPFNWSLDEGLITGSDTCNDAGGGGMQIPITIAAEGTLANTLHTLKITSTGTTGVDYLFIDAIDVHDQVLSRTRIESDAWDIVGPSFVTDTGDNAPTEASGGLVTYAAGSGVYSEISFTGTGVALIGKMRWDEGQISWNIDSGTYSGTICQGSNTCSGDDPGWAGAHHRWSWLLQTGMTNTTHTLQVLSSTPVIVLDAIDVVDSSTPVENWMIY